MSHEAAVASQPAGESLVGKLARFFPAAAPVRIAVQVTDHGARRESTVIEFGTPTEILFSSTLPLEFADSLRVRNADGSLDIEVRVVALQYESGRTAVAARFVGNVANWIVKP